MTPSLPLGMRICAICAFLSLSGTVLWCSIRWALWSDPLRRGTLTAERERGSQQSGAGD